MAKEKTPKELGEILSEQLDTLRGGDIGDEDIRIAEAVANIVGKVQKQAALEIMYRQARKEAVGIIPSLHR